MWFVSKLVSNSRWLTKASDSVYLTNTETGETRLFPLADIRALIDMNEQIDGVKWVVEGHGELRNCLLSAEISPVHELITLLNDSACTVRVAHTHNDSVFLARSGSSAVKTTSVKAIKALCRSPYFDCDIKGAEFVEGELRLTPVGINGKLKAKYKLMSGLDFIVSEDLLVYLGGDPLAKTYEIDLRGVCTFVCGDYICRSAEFTPSIVYPFNRHKSSISDFLVAIDLSEWLEAK